MSSSSQLIEAFEGLSYTSKLAKLKAMMSALKDAGGILSELHQLLEHDPNINENLLTIIYRTVVETADQVKQQIQEQHMQKYADIQQALKNLKTQEENSQENIEDIFHKFDA